MSNLWFFEIHSYEQLVFMNSIVTGKTIQIAR